MPAISGTLPRAHGQVIFPVKPQSPGGISPGAFLRKERPLLPCLFNSFDPYFKQPFGAVRAGQSVHLSLCIPEELGYVDPHLVLQKEGRFDVPVHYRMNFDGQTPRQNHFSVEVPLNDPGLYFYYFDLYPTSAASCAGRQLRRGQLAGG